MGIGNQDQEPLGHEEIPGRQPAVHAAKHRSRQPICSGRHAVGTPERPRTNPGTSILGGFGTHPDRTRIHGEPFIEECTQRIWSKQEARIILHGLDHRGARVPARGSRSVLEVRHAVMVRLCDEAAMRDRPWCCDCRASRTIDPNERSQRTIPANSLGTQHKERPCNQREDESAAT